MIIDSLHSVNSGWLWVAVIVAVLVIVILAMKVSFEDGYTEGFSDGLLVGYNSARERYHGMGN